MKKIFFAGLFLVFSSYLTIGFSGTGGTFDGNFYVDAAAADGNISGGTIDADIVLTDIPTGGWHAVDLYFREGLFFDQNIPGVTITSPSNNSTSTSNSVTVTYTVEEIGNPVNKFFVRQDTNSWIDNGINRSYTFTNLSNADHNFSVIATDAYDLNSTTKSVTVTVNVASTAAAASTTSTAATVAGSTGGAGGSSAPKVTPSDVQDPKQVVSETKFAPVTATTSEGLAFTRDASYKVVKSSQTGGTATVWSFNVGIKNDTAKPRQNVIVTETIPKEIASNISLITFADQPTKIVNPDPVVEWLVEELKPGEDKKFLYYVTSISNKQVSKNLGAFLATIPPAQVKSEEKSEDSACASVNCDDSNICTQDSCSAGQCSNVPSRDGIRCANGYACRAGKCVEEPTALITPPVEEQAAPGEKPKEGSRLDSGLLLAVLAILTIIVIVIGAAMFKAGKKPSTAQAAKLFKGKFK